MTTLHWVYILRCSDESLYTGYALDVEARLRMHNEGKAAKYTRGRRPVVLVYQEGFTQKGDALRREMAIKALDKSKKLQLIDCGIEVHGG